VSMRLTGQIAVVVGAVQSPGGAFRGPSLL
jgi:hypothetical protein